MHCGRPITIASLDVSHQVVVKHDCLDRLRLMDSKVASATLGMLEFFNRFDSQKYGTEGAPLHDPCTIAYLLQPELFLGKTCNVEVETGSPLTIGHTAVDFWGVTDRPANVNWLYQVNREGFFDLLLDRLASYRD
jgi:purine nucleosidase